MLAVCDASCCSSQLSLFLVEHTADPSNNESLRMLSPDMTIFRAVQQLARRQSDRLSKIWEPVYTIVYRTARPEDFPAPDIPWDPFFVDDAIGTDELPKVDVVKYLQKYAQTEWLKTWKLNGKCKSITKSRNARQVAAAYTDFVQFCSGQSMRANRSAAEHSMTSIGSIGTPTSSRLHLIGTPTSSRMTMAMQASLNSSRASAMDSSVSRLDASNIDGDDDDDEDEDEEAINPTKLMLNLIHVLYQISKLGVTNSSNDDDDAVAEEDDLGFVVKEADFISHKLNTKLRQQLMDPLVLASNALPTWCEELTTSCPVLFPFETRQLYFSSSAFGVSRTIAWIQNQRQQSDRARLGSAWQPDNGQEFRVGRLKSERVFVPRGDQLLEWAVNVMRVHAPRKTVLDIEFKGEQGTGLGPTLEFYNLVAKELQKKSLCMWMCTDEVDTSAADKADATGNAESSEKPFGYYVLAKQGLFPVALPRGAPHFHDIVERFRFLGVFVAKSLQDNRLVDLPLSLAMFKLMCGRKLDLTDLMQLDPEHGKVLHQIQDMVMKKREIEADDAITTEARTEAIGNLKYRYQAAEPGSADPNDGTCDLADLGLYFVYTPPSSVYGVVEHPLRAGGGDEEVTIYNAEDYVQLRTDFMLEIGLAPQLEAFRGGFNEVFPIDKLAIFTPEEVQNILCGEQRPEWNIADLTKYTEPKFGYTRDSAGYTRFLEVLDELGTDERKAFLKFATGCPSLPPGGLANLHPRLTVVRKT